jgi:hypothetical protein
MKVDGVTAHFNDLTSNLGSRLQALKLDPQKLAIAVRGGIFEGTLPDFHLRWA